MPQAGQVAPSFTAKTLDGRDVAFPSAFKDRKVLLVFWATWCGPCRREIPHLREAQTKYAARGLEIVSVSIDTGPAASVKDFVEREKMSWNVLLAGGAEAARLYGVTAIPAMLLVDGTSGRVLADSAEFDRQSLMGTLARHLGTTKG
ncbi:MAG: TlpA family protein disulfide reductase [Phycisphaerae bacterium]|nr:TlpA family protein disulfide reductase [Phycisphaerae bacterium]